MSTVDPNRARSGRRLGVLALGATVLGWLPLLLLSIDPSWDEATGDVAYGLAMPVILGAALMVPVGAIVGFVLASMAHRREPGERFASIALGLASLSGGCTVAMLIFLWVA